MPAFGGASLTMHLVQQVQLLQIAGTGRLPVKADPYIGSGRYDSILSRYDGREVWNRYSRKFQFNTHLVEPNSKLKIRKSDCNSFTVLYTKIFILLNVDQ
ncbi:MAG: hypothetical protein K0Q63_831 [Paenibacillus sp.]|nr:hypothetical protein [Paenibacillus sp.]